MEKLVVIVGTRHSIQVGRVNGTEFAAYLAGVIDAFGVRSVGEELSQQALDEFGVALSIAQGLALERGLAHRMCDPDGLEREANMIGDEAGLKMAAFFENWDAGRLEAAVTESHRKREVMWVDCLAECERWPALFVCGASHVASFVERLEKAGFLVQVAAADWET